MQSGFDFGTALKFLRQGKKVSRLGWNGKGMYLYFVSAESYPTKTEAARAEFGEMTPYTAYIAIKTVYAIVCPWTASQSDLLADDWVVVE